MLYNTSPLKQTPTQMSFLLANFLGSTDGPTGSTASSSEMKRELVEKICAKMTDSAHLEDRRAAAQTLKSLARSHQLVKQGDLRTSSFTFILGNRYFRLTSAD
jgi:hypothetical protein